MDNLATRIKAPLISTPAARAFLGISEERLRELAARGDLVAFDLRSRGRRQNLRFLSSAVARFPQANRPLPAILAEILPGESRTIPAPAIARALNIDSQTVYCLIRAGLLKARGTWRRGHGGAALITRDSVVRFLSGRRIGQNALKRPRTLGGVSTPQAGGSDRFAMTPRRIARGSSESLDRRKEGFRA